MLPEIAWSLKLGEPIVGTTFQGKKVEGTVAGLLRKGLSVQDFLQCGHSEMSAARMQFDAPTILMRVEGSDVRLFWRPDDVERITDEYTIKCHVCNQFITLRLALRTINKMAKGELLPYCLELEKPSVAEQIIKSACKFHV